MTRQTRRVQIVSHPNDGLLDDFRRVRNERLAQRLAAALGYEYTNDPPTQPTAHSYWVPYETLVGYKLAEELGIRSSRDLFGGVAAFAFQATKSIVHGLIDSHANRPEGWQPSFSEWVTPLGLPGYTVFSFKDAKVAYTRPAARYMPTTPSR